MTTTPHDNITHPPETGAYADRSTVCAVLPMPPWSFSLNSAQARDLAAALLDAAAEVNAWVDRQVLR